MRVDVLTLFPQLFDPFFQTSMVGLAEHKELVRYQAHNFRDFATDKHHTVDDAPYGGGGGMVLKPDPLFAAVDHLLDDAQTQARVILMCPQGERFTQDKAIALSEEVHLIFICGHYEGVDERVREHLVTDEISIGDYVLTGGEVPAMAVIESVVRLLPGVLGNEMSAVTDSFRTGLLEHPHYTRPAQFRDWEVPEVLLSGHHEHIEQWRHKQALYRTWQRRPDLIEARPLTEMEQQWLKQFNNETRKQ